jgi:hypothetical protein
MLAIKELRTWMKRKGLAMKLLSNPASDTSAQVTAGFATGHAAPSSLEIPHCDHTKQVSEIQKVHS